MSDATNKLAAIFERAFAVDRASFTPELTPEAVQKWDSLGHMNLVAELEKEFNVQFDIDEVMEMVSVPAILGILAKKTG